MKSPLRNRKFIGLYIFWSMFHLTLLVISLGKDDVFFGGTSQSEFFPISARSIAEAYDYTEFLIYMIFPLGIIYGLYFIKSEKNEM